jgi:hypothetical protein
MTKTQRGVLGALLSFALAPVLSACGGSGGSCGGVQPCGGDVVGNWTISGECVNTASANMQIMAECPGASISTSGIRVTGNVTFNADMTYAVTETISASVRETIPLSCLQSGTTRVTCAQLDQELQMEFAQDPSASISGHCVGSSACTCTFTIPSQTVSQSGTYSTSGTAIIMTGSSSNVQYCVQGNEMHMMTLNATMPMGSMGQLNIDSDLVLKK